jgi:large subunit ribosomal protein L30e
MDFETSLRRAVKTGRVLVGQNSTKQTVLEGNAQMVVIAQNCPKEFTSFVQGKDVFTYTYEGSGVQLGKACGKPFMVSALAVVDAGESDIMNLMRA